MSTYYVNEISNCTIISYDISLFVVITWELEDRSQHGINTAQKLPFQLVRNYFIIKTHWKAICKNLCRTEFIGPVVRGPRAWDMGPKINKVRKNNTLESVPRIRLLDSLLVCSLRSYQSKKGRRWKFYEIYSIFLFSDQHFFCIKKFKNLYTHLHYE